MTLLRELWHVTIKEHRSLPLAMQSGEERILEHDSAMASLIHEMEVFLRPSVPYCPSSFIDPYTNGRSDAVRRRKVSNWLNVSPRTWWTGGWPYRS